MRQAASIKDLLQSATEVCYKVHQVLQSVTEIYYKVSQVLKAATDCYYEACGKMLLQSASDITQCDRYYKVRRNYHAPIKKKILQASENSFISNDDKKFWQRSELKSNDAYWKRSKNMWWNNYCWHYWETLSLREKCPNTELFLVRISLYSVQI